MIALAAAVGVNVALASSGIVMINGQIQGILFILVIGAATDYGLLYTARYREELRKLPPSDKHLGSAWQATRAAWLGSSRPILASAVTVSAGLLCLLFSDLASNSGLGPVAAVGIGCAMIISLTFLPAVLFLTGSRVFWPRVPTPSESNADAASPAWSWVAKTVSRRPWQLAVGVSVVLAAGCVGVATLHADGVPQSEFVLGESQARDGQAALDKHFPGALVLRRTSWFPKKRCRLQRALFTRRRGLNRYQYRVRILRRAHSPFPPMARWILEQWSRATVLSLASLVRPPLLMATSYCQPRYRRRCIPMTHNARSRHCVTN